MIPIWLIILLVSVLIIILYFMLTGKLKESFARIEEQPKGPVVKPEANTCGSFCGGK